MTFIEFIRNVLNMATLEDQIIALSNTANAVQASITSLQTTVLALTASVDKLASTPITATVDLSTVLAPLATLQTSVDGINAQFAETPQAPTA